MKPTLHLSGVVLLFFLLILSSFQSTHLLSTNQGQEIKPLKITKGVSHAQTVQDDTSMNELMGLETACENGDEECSERRMASEAHLDYIYTQKHKP